MNKYILQFYDDETWGYKGIDDEDKNIVFEQGLEEERETFFNRVGQRPAANEYGSNENMDKEINNGNRYSRIIFALQRYGLNKLINDEDWEVRAIVAEKGYRLDKLIDDEDEEVREVARDKLKKIMLKRAKKYTKNSKRNIK